VQIINTYNKKELKQLHYKDTDYVLKVYKIDIYGTLYRYDSFVVIDNGIETKDGKVIFGRIKEIIILDDNVYFWCEEWPEIWFNESLNAYCVDKSDQTCFINASELCDSKPFSLWFDFKTNFSYIALRNMLL